MKLLNGLELSLFIKERQASDVQKLISKTVTPKLAIVQCIDDPVINTYVRNKKIYGADIHVLVDHYQVQQSEIKELVTKLNQDKSVDGIIIQLPLEDPKQTEEIVNSVDPSKDVDSLGKDSKFDPATPQAIMWLLSGFNIDLQGKKVLIIGKGRLVGIPLEKILTKSGIDVTMADRNTNDINILTKQADVIITATGSPAILYPEMVKTDSVIVDAGVASEEGKTVGDVAPEMYEREDITITPKKGGVGPLTISALFENVIRSAQQRAKSD